MIINMDGPETKAEFAELVANFGYKVGAEIGIREGEMAALILRHGMDAYYMVDPWVHQDEKQYHEAVNYSQEGHDHNFLATIDRIKPFKNFVIMRMYSEQAARIVPDESLDWVYIDANHAYQWASRDLNLWGPKVKPKHMVAGHDFLDLDFPERFGVKTAVREFFPSDQIIHTSEAEWPIWWTMKR